MPQRKQTSAKEPKEGSSKSMRIIRNEKQAKWVEGAQRKELVNVVDVKANKPPKVKDMVIGPKKPKRCVAKAHKNVRMEWAKDAERNEAGRGCIKEWYESKEPKIA